ESDPGTAQGSAMEVHAAAAAYDGWVRLFVQAVHVCQADQGRVLRWNRLFGRADFQCRPRRARRRLGSVAIAVKAVLAGIVTGLNLDQSHVQPRILVASKGQRACNMDRADHLVRFQVISDRMPRAYLDPGAGGWNLATVPGGRRRPTSAAGGTHDGRCRLIVRLFCRTQREGETAGGGEQRNRQGRGTWVRRPGAPPHVP